ncbi:SDR family NAD(P)-dependent oxidoreductase [Nocardia bovistercoris]|uniref:SDR family NAD(P)-dependent oxidoreductase n=1 Tax=Nocardia bovistercoris TaxID=2785916 RepID=A0A931IG30_9NOCA|nr:SDR family NAD(P)-dependent oxidoreductase [Nocardia bovistercoris]MBH0780894.1 SDR family NAD(P)-dependent oxidoreductase [Nocardia bovistercoris]
MSRRFDGKVVVVTGAASGIGAATARLFAAHGAKVHVCDINATGATSVCDQIIRAGGEAVAHAVDVADPRAMEALAADVFAIDPIIDVLHNNAGIGWAGPAENMTIQDWRRVVDVNLNGVVNGIHYFLPRMLAQGRHAHVLNTASSAGLFPIPYLSAYTATKFGIVGLTQALNAELAARGVRFTAICPGAVDTPIIGNTAKASQGSERITDLVHRFGRRPEAVAKAAVDAVGSRKVIVTVHAEAVLPPWWLHRLTPAGFQLAERAALRFASRAGAVYRASLGRHG